MTKATSLGVAVLVVALIIFCIAVADKPSQKGWSQQQFNACWKKASEGIGEHGFVPSDAVASLPFCD